MGKGRSTQRTPEIHGLALVGHTSVGKTTLAEMWLHAAGVVRAPGKVEEGTALLDFEATERRKHQSLTPGYAWLPVGDAVIQLVDTPGADVGGYERDLVVAASGCAGLVVDPQSGLQSGDTRWLRWLADRRLPTILIAQKADRTYDPDVFEEEVAAFAQRKVVPVCRPWFEDDVLVGLLDIAGDRALRFAEDGSGAFSPEPIPAGLRPMIDELREQLMEAVALTDDELVQEYLEFFELSPESLARGLKGAVARCDLLPVMYTAAAVGIGGVPSLQCLMDVLPSRSEIVEPMLADEPFAAQWVGTQFDEDGEPVAIMAVWKGPWPTKGGLVHAQTGATWKPRKLYQLRGTRRAAARFNATGMFYATWELPPGQLGDVFGAHQGVQVPMVRRPPTMAWLWARRPSSLSDVKARTWVERLRAKDPSIEVQVTRRWFKLAGHSEPQLRMALRRVSEWSGHKLIPELPAIDYRERPKARVQQVRGVHLVQSGGDVKEFGEVYLDVGPSAESDWTFGSTIDDDILPDRFVAGAGVGAERALVCGPQGFPVIGVSATCVGGEYDVLESEPEHFELAGERAMRAALGMGGTELLEPWHTLTIHVPASELGPVLSDLASHRARVLGLEVEQDEAEVVAQVPFRELRSYSGRLEALTHGLGWFDQKTIHYDSLPEPLAEQARRHALRSESS